jgi:hypothetical protein
MRSNDAPEATYMNAFAFIMLQKSIADNLKVDVGSYFHRANSFHCYEKDFKLLESYISSIESGAEITLVGLDVTEKCRLTKEEALAPVMGESREMCFLQGELERFFTNFNFLPVLHDPLTVAAVIWDDLMTFEMKDIVIETKGEYTRGVTAERRFSDKKAIRTAVSVKAREAVERMVKRIREEA